MSLPVHLADDLPHDLAGVAVGAVVELTGPEAHHAVAVRRTRAGERLVLTDGRGTSVTGTVVATGKQRLDLRAETVDTVERPAPSVTVVQALPKGDRGELAVEVLTEIGVDRIVPWAAERSVAVWKGERAAKSLARWRATAREAAKQSRRVWHPQVAGLAGLDEVCALVSGAAAAWSLHEDATDPLAGVSVPDTGEVVLVVGPEGGISEPELAALRAAGARPRRLGAEVLRTSTAGVAATAALLSRTPRWA